MNILERKIKILEALLSGSNERNVLLFNAKEVYREEVGLLKKLNKEQGLEIQKLHTQLLASKASSYIKCAASGLEEIKKEVVDAPLIFSIEEAIKKGVISPQKVKLAKEQNIKNGVLSDKKEIGDATTNFSDKLKSPLFHIPFSGELGFPEWDSHASYESGVPVMFRGEKLYAFKDGVEPSLFMPNVKFIVPKEHLSLFIKYTIPKIFDDEWIAIDGNGEAYEPHLITDFNNIKTVSIYEAKPELVPDGMVYDKESDSLVSNEEAVVLKNRREFGTDYHPDDVAFKVTEVVSICNICSKKPQCTLISKIYSSPAITECFDFKKKLKSPVHESIELVKILDELQLLLWGSELPILIGVEFNADADEDDIMKTNHTISFTTIDRTKKS